MTAHLTRTVDELERIAGELVVRIRDYDPAANGRWLTAVLPDRCDWFRLAFVLAAAVPDDRTWRQLTAWADQPATAANNSTEPDPVVQWSRQTQPCGTMAAVRRHRRHGQPLDEQCREASRAHERQRGARRRAMSREACR